MFFIKQLVYSMFIIFFCNATQVWKYRLNSGRDCPIIGLGTGGFKTGGPPQGHVVKQIIRNAIESGYRHFDTALSYGNEQAIGQSLNDLINEGTVKREDIFLTTKIYSIRENSTRSSEEALNGVHMALQKLNLTYIDLMLIHSPSEVPAINSEVWSGLEEALNKGLVKSIGVSNFNVSQLESLISRAKVFPAMNQIESHPKLNQKQIIDFCTHYKIKTTAYSPLGSGSLLNDTTIVGIGNKYNKSSAQVMIRWQIQRGVVVIPKSTNRQRIRDNINVFDFNLTEDEMKILNQL